MGHGKGEHDGARACVKCALRRYQMNHFASRLANSNNVVNWCKQNLSHEFNERMGNVRRFCCEHIETCSPDGCKACRGTVDYGLKYDANQKINLEGYVNSDWVGSAIDRKSTLGCCFSMGLGVISWFSRKQYCVALSTAEAEYVAACSASCEAVWLRKLLLIYLISSWMLLVYIVTTRVA